MNKQPPTILHSYYLFSRGVLQAKNQQTFFFKNTVSRISLGDHENQVRNQQGDPYCFKDCSLLLVL